MYLALENVVKLCRLRQARSSLAYLRQAVSCPDVLWSSPYSDSLGDDPPDTPRETSSSSSRSRTFGAGVAAVVVVGGGEEQGKAKPGNYSGWMTRMRLLRKA